MAKSKSLRPTGDASSSANQTNQSNRKARPSITVFDQPSSLNSRIKQLETDVLRLDEERTKLADDVHSQLAQCELKLTELYAILKSRRDNVDRYADDIKLLLTAKDDFGKRAVQLSEQYDRLHEKFVQRETNVSRDIRTFKAKFTVLEKNKQIGSILQKCEGVDKQSSAIKSDQSADTDKDCFNTLEDNTTLNKSQANEREAGSNKLLSAGKEVKSRLAKLSGFKKVIKPQVANPSKKNIDSNRSKISALVRLNKVKLGSPTKAKVLDSSIGTHSSGSRQNLFQLLVQRLYSLLNFVAKRNRVVPKSKLQH